jgi:hypothetical protein
MALRSLSERAQSVAGMPTFKGVRKMYFVYKAGDSCFMTTCGMHWMGGMDPRYSWGGILNLGILYI